MDTDPDPIFKALADPTRRGILDLLRGGGGGGAAQTTSDLVNAFPHLSRFAVMKHLDVLEEAGLLLVRREGRQRFNYLNAVPLRQVYERWVNRFEDRWAGSLVSLKRVVEGAVSNPELAMPGATDTTSTPESQSRLMRIEQEVLIDGTAQHVFEALTGQVGDWWPHRFKPGASRVVLEPRLGGRFYEDWGTVDGRQTGALYGEITYFDPPTALCIRGSFGMRGAAIVTKWHRLEPRGPQTLLRVSLHASGEIPDDVMRAYQAGTREVLVGALKPFVETGRKYSA